MFTKNTFLLKSKVFTVYPAQEVQINLICKNIEYISYKKMKLDNFNRLNKYKIMKQNFICKKRRSLNKHFKNIN
jgi:hypothetical protein